MAFLPSPDSHFFAVTDESGLIGYRSFGADGQVPGGEYDDSALDTGGGLRPDLTGKGLGQGAIQTGLDFGQRQFAPLGFRNIGSFRASADGRSYEMLIRPSSGL